MWNLASPSFWIELSKQFKLLEVFKVSVCRAELINIFNRNKAVFFKGI